MDKRSGVVVLVNGANGMVIMPDLVGELMPGDHPAFAWLNYPRQPPPPKAKETKEGKDPRNGKEAKYGLGRVLNGTKACPGYYP